MKNIRVLPLYTTMYKKLNDRHKNKTAYPQRVQYLDGSYRLSLLLKLITLPHETNSFGKSFQADTEWLQQIFMHTLLLNNFLVILKLWPRVFELLRKKNQPLPNQRAYGKSCNKRVNQPWVAWFSKYLYLEHEDNRNTLGVQDRIAFW